MKFTVAIVFASGALLQFLVFGDDLLCKEGPPKKELWECCNVPNLIEKSIRVDCLEKYGEQTAKQLQMEGTPRGCCIAECQLNATGLYTNGMVNRENMTKIFLDSTKDMPQWQSLVSDQLDECFQLAEANWDIIEAGSKLEPAFEGEKICHPISGAIMRCMNKNLFTKCPMESATESPECTKMINYFNMCPIPEKSKIFYITLQSYNS